MKEQEGGGSGEGGKGSLGRPQSSVDLRAGRADPHLPRPASGRDTLTCCCQQSCEWDPGGFDGGESGGRG